MSNISYKDAGVDLDLYQQAMKRLPGLMQKTHSSRVMDLPGGFAGLFRLNSADSPQKNYEDPVMVSGTDGVGTKVKVAQLTGRHNTVGIDLVAMCVNDCLCLGAEPLFFLDYIALGKDDPELIVQLVEGVSAGCTQSNMALLGGETAIMPDLYQPGDFDMAGFCVGVAEKNQLIDGTATIQAGDTIIGLASAGFHSNGYSLLRKVVLEAEGLSVDDKVEDLNATVGETLLTPTRIYVEEVTAVLDQFHRCDNSPIHGLAHITGGGLPENIERILPESCKAVIDCNSWEPNPAFNWLTSLDRIDQDEMFKVFNMGIGFAMIVDSNSADAILEKLKENSVESWKIGDIQSGQRAVQLVF